MIGPLSPPQRGRHGRPAVDNWRFLNGMIHVLRVGCPWRDMHERYGKTALSFESFLNLAAARLWLKSFVNAAWSEKPDNARKLDPRPQCCKWVTPLAISHRMTA
ncbi:transposase [Qipengyuania spongiae]|uniref:Transposase n=1 Tax=Qipengyuania spongiae TaxID=2909673 RepID=A0ABY5T0W3_9SPHN|nr:transposase [Qipengyuania spongiae]